jgi:hypothetical protein
MSGLDRALLVITEIYAIVALLALVVVMTGATWLVLRVRRLIRMVRGALKELAAETKGTGEALRRDVGELKDRMDRVAEVLRDSSGRIREAWRASATSTAEHRES